MLSIEEEPPRDALTGLKASPRSLRSIARRSSSACAPLTVSSRSVVKRFLLATSTLTKG